MTLKEYTDVALQFAKDTADWGGLDTYKHYTTTGYKWEESSDNASGGLDISWAFHLTGNEIKAMATDMYLQEIKSMLEQAIDEDWDSEQLGWILECMN